MKRGSLEGFLGEASCVPISCSRGQKPPLQYVSSLDEQSLGNR